MGKKELNYTLSLKDLFSKGMRGAVTETDKLDKKMSAMSEKGGGLTGSIVSANLMTNALGRAGRAMVDLEVSSVKSYMKMEMYEARMTTLLHNRKAAIGAIKNIQLDAAKTPFDLDSLIQANSMLIGAGESAGGARKVAMDLGNAIAATGGGSDELNRMAVNLGQIRSIGKATAMDVRQFMFANIPIYEMLAKSMGKTTKQVKDMDISYKDLAKALADARKEGGMFYQGLENANKTLTGSVSNLGDAWDRLKTTIGKSQSGILKDTVNWANGMLNSLNQSIDMQNRLEESLKGGGGRAISAGDKLSGEWMKNMKTSILLDVKSQKANQTEEGAKGNELYLRKALRNITQKYESGAISAVDYGRTRAMLRANLSDTMQAQNEFAIGKQKAKDEKAAAKASAASTLGSSVDVYGARPQNLTININKLIENFTISTTNMTDSTQKVKENVSKAILEAVNDVNQMVK